MNAQRNASLRYAALLLVATVAAHLPGGSAAAEETAAAKTKPTLLHYPPISAGAGRGVLIEVTTTGDWHLESMMVKARSVAAEGASESFVELPLRRVKGNQVSAEIPADMVQPPGIEYAIVSMRRDGNTSNHFASTDHPHRVNVYGDSDVTQMRRRLARWGGRRSRIALRTELSAFGARKIEQGADLPDSAETDNYSDRYWQIEADYTYRPLRTIYDFRFGFGVMRGSWPEVDDESIGPSDTDTPGLNYGFAEVNLRVHEHLSLGGRVLLGASAEGFVAGGGVVTRLGYLTGTHIAARLEAIEDIGGVLDLRFHWATLPRYPMALGVELTDWPHEDSPRATKLSYDLGWRASETLIVTARVGIANRTESQNAGLLGGLHISQDF